MAKVTIKDGKEYQLHGTFCGIVYRYVNGKQYAHLESRPTLPDRATTTDRLKYQRKVIVQRCVAYIQREEYKRGEQSAERVQEIADKYQAIKKAVGRMYDDFLPKFKLNTGKMQEAIIYWYCYKKLTPELELFKDKLPAEYRQ